METKRICKGCSAPIPEIRLKRARYCTNTCQARSAGKRFYAKHPEKRAALNKAYRIKHSDSPEAKFAKQKANAFNRGLEFTLTFEEWVELWAEHWDERGQGGYHMCRFEDKGGYTLGNVRIDTHAHNAQESWTMRKKHENL